VGETLAAALDAHPPALAAAAAAKGARGVELGAADRPVAVGVETLEALLAPLPALLAAGLGSGAYLFLGDEAVAIGVGTGEARLHLRLDRRTGLRVGETAAAVAALGENGRRGQRRYSEDD
jgi:hypothetical protein